MQQSVPTATTSGRTSDASIAATSTGLEARSQAIDGAGRSFDSRPLLLHYGAVALLIAWCGWWGLSLFRMQLAGVGRGWFIRCLTAETFGGDFIWHVDAPTRTWLSGQDPYEPKGDGDILLYPPLVLRLFAWVGVMNSHRALTLWVVALAMMAAVSCRESWKCRQRLGLNFIPLPAVMVAVLFSSPMVFAMERGQFDLITAPLVLAGLVLMRRETRFSQFAAGVVMAVAPLAKVYPGILGVGLVGLRRWRAASAFAILGLSVCVAMRDETKKFLGNIDLHSSKVRAYLQIDQGTLVHPWNHSIPDNWPRVWRDTPVRVMSQIPGHVAAVIILGTLLLLVSRRIVDCPQRQSLGFPYLMWIVAVGSFVPPMANSYNVMFLPLAALSVCSRRDPLLCRIMLWTSVVWLQPFHLPIEGRWLFLLKISTLASVGWSLVERVRELEQRAGGNVQGARFPSTEIVRQAA